mmetsp:Transcript_48771/g.138405  ORF Transcript_48771/g.138405 Transcript_48771/m.138405 type:complete len:380 (-) Transcript_48771:4-1143(-)
MHRRGLGRMKRRRRQGCRHRCGHQHRRCQRRRAHCCTGALRKGAIASRTLRGTPSVVALLRTPCIRTAIQVSNASPFGDRWGWAWRARWARGGRRRRGRGGARRRWGRGWRWIRGRTAGNRAQHRDVCAIAKLLAGACCRVALDAGATPILNLPTGGLHLRKVAAVSGCRNATVRGPPPPLQSARRALQILGDLEAHLVRADARWQVPTLRIVHINQLAVPTCVVCHTIAGPRRAKQLVLVQAALRVRRAVPEPLIADAKFEVTLVVCRDLHAELRDLARSEDRLCTFTESEEVTVAPLATIAANPSTVATMRAVSVHAAARSASSQGREVEPAMASAPWQQTHQDCDCQAATLLHHACDLTKCSARGRTCDLRRDEAF